MISLKRPAQEPTPDPALRRCHPVHRTVGISSWGRGRGGNPLPVVRNHTGPSPGPPRRIGAMPARSPEGRKPGEATQNTLFHRHLPIHRSPLSPTPPALRAPPPPKAGAVQVISPERPTRGVGPRSHPSPASSHAPEGAYPGRRSRIPPSYLPIPPGVIPPAGHRDLSPRGMICRLCARETDHSGGISLFSPFPRKKSITSAFMGRSGRSLIDGLPIFVQHLRASVCISSVKHWLETAQNLRT